MPFLPRDKGAIYYEWVGRVGAPVLILSHSLGTNRALWAPQLPVFTKHFRILLYDHPGHGRSKMHDTRGGIADYGQDVLALMNHLGLQKPCFCGLSLGGMVGIWLGATAGDRFKKIVLCNTAAKIENPQMLRRRITEIRKRGLAAISTNVLEKWFSSPFLKNHPKIVRQARRMLLTTESEGYARTAEIVCYADLRNALDKIQAPLLVVYGANDLATPPALNTAIAAKVYGAESLRLDAAHLSNIEAADDFNKGVLEWCLSRPGTPFRIPSMHGQL